MNRDSSLGQIEYNPGRLLDALIEKLNLKNDAALSRALQVAPPTISKIRHHKTDVGAPLLVRMHEMSNLNIKELRRLMGDRRIRMRTRGKKFKSVETATA
jgi:hypothetical protein